MKQNVCCAVALLSALAGGALVKKIWREKYRQLQGEKERLEKEQTLFRAWLQAERGPKTCSAVLAARGYQRIAILGMNWEGRLLAEILGDAAVYGVEQENFGAIHPRLTVYRLGEDPLPPADCLIICADGTDTLAQAKKEFPGDVITLCELLEWTVPSHP